MCRNRFWGVAGAIGSAYFAYLTYLRVRDADFLWPHNGWALLTYLVWTGLALGLVSETRCSRERVFFGLALLNLAIGFVFSLWDAAPLNYARESREVALLIWVLAAAASLATLAHPKEASIDGL